MTTSRPDRILIFGGTFDPPHLAHARLPPIAAGALGCDRIIYVPAAINPLKAAGPTAPPHHRLAMLRLAVRGIREAEIDTQELDRPGPSYTVDTLTALHARFGPDVHLFLLIGADAALDFERWKDWRRILELAEPAVMPRPPHPRKQLIEAFRAQDDLERAAYWIAHIVEVPYLDISATDVRSRLESGGDLAGLLDLAVIEYIRAHGLYEPKNGTGTFSGA